MPKSRIIKLYTGHTGVLEEFGGDVCDDFVMNLEKN
jgi:hypothetical protein